MSASSGRFLITSDWMSGLTTALALHAYRAGESWWTIGGWAAIAIWNYVRAWQEFLKERQS